MTACSFPLPGQTAAAMGSASDHLASRFNGVEPIDALLCAQTVVSRRALGVDVSFSRGLDVVVFHQTGELVLGPRNTNPAGLRALVEEAQPDIVAIDSPPEWAREGRSRLIERQLQALGIHIYACPTDPGDHKFYRWMRVGFEAFDAVAGAGYSLYRGGPLAARQVGTYPPLAPASWSGVDRCSGRLASAPTVCTQSTRSMLPWPP